MAVGSKEKYTKEQRRKTHSIEQSDDEHTGSGRQAEHHPARPGVNKPQEDAELARSGSMAVKRGKHKAKKNSAKQSVHTRPVQAQPPLLELQPIDALRKKARKKQIRGSSSMTQLELIQALKSAMNE